MRPTRVQQLEAFNQRCKTKPGEVDEAAIVDAIAAARTITRFAVPIAALLMLGSWLTVGALLWHLGRTLEDSPGLVLIGALVFLVLPFVNLLRALRASDFAEDAIRNTAPLSESAVACKDAIHLVSKTAACARLRDVVVARGEVLRIFHVRAMDAIDRASTREQLCRSLHVVPETAKGRVVAWEGRTMKLQSEAEGDNEL